MTESVFVFHRGSRLVFDSSSGEKITSSANDILRTEADNGLKRLGEANRDTGSA